MSCVDLLSVNLLITFIDVWTEVHSYRLVWRDILFCQPARFPGGTKQSGQSAAKKTHKPW